MEIPQASSAPDSTAANGMSLRELISDAIRYWEPRRVGYNLVLAAIVLGWVGLTWPHFRGAFTWPSVLAVFVLAVLANICYCAAYLIDVTVQHSVFRDSWRKKRWALWAVGVAFAAALTYHWIADEIYPSVM